MLGAAFLFPFWKRSITWTRYIYWYNPPLQWKKEKYKTCNSTWLSWMLAFSFMSCNSVNRLLRRIIFFANIYINCVELVACASFSFLKPPSTWCRIIKINMTIINTAAIIHLLCRHHDTWYHQRLPLPTQMIPSFIDTVLPWRHLHLPLHLFPLCVPCCQW